MVVAPCLTLWQWSPTLTGLCDWTISVHQEILQSAVFLNEKLDLWFHFACWPFSKVLSQVFCQECLFGSVWVCLGTFPTLWFAWALSAGILAALSLLLYPSQSPSLCVIHSFMEWVVGISDGSEECFDLLHFISVSAQSTWKWQLYTDLICASKQTHFALVTWNSEQVPVELYTQRSLNSHQGGSFTELFGCYIATWNCYGLCTWSVNTIQPCTTLLL